MSSSSVARVALALAACLVASGVRGNGAGSVTVKTTGALAGSSGGALGTTELIAVPEIECVSEELAIHLGAEGASVQVDYVLVNHGETRTIDYAFPFAIGEGVAEIDGRVTRSERMGEPTSYSIAVDGKRLASTKRPGAPIPAGIHVPIVLDSSFGRDGKHSTRYVWSYRVSQIEFPAGKARKVRVRYGAPYLVHTVDREEFGVSRGLGSLSYILSTGSGWRGGTIGRLLIRVTSDSAPDDVRVDGLSFRRERSGWIYEARDFAPTVEKNLLIRQVQWEEVWLDEEPWTSPPVRPERPVTIPRRLTGDDDLSGAKDLGRYRLGLRLPAEAGMAQLSAARVALEFRARPPEVFNAAFAPTSGVDLEREEGFREIWFEARSRPIGVTLTLLDVIPGARGSRSIRLDGTRLLADVSDY